MCIHASFLETVCLISITNLRLSAWIIMPLHQGLTYAILMQLAAEYVKQNKLEVRGAQELARAIKDHERRPQGREVCSEAISL